PGAAAKDVIASLGTALAGKIVIDATNDVQGSGKLHALDELADGAHPVRAFNTLGWENFADPIIAGVTADLLYAAEHGLASDAATPPTPLSGRAASSFPHLPPPPPACGPPSPPSAAPGPASL